jgi:hypothetical protein
VRKNCTLGSVRGAPGNRRPYRGGLEEHQCRNSNGIAAVIIGQQEPDSPCASTKAKMKAAMSRPCQAGRSVATPGENRGVPSPAALRVFSASAWSASSSQFPRAGPRVPQAPWPNQALHRTAQQSAPPVNLVVIRLKQGV